MNSEAQICMQTPARTIVAKSRVPPWKLPTETERLAVRTRPPGRKPVMYQRWDDLLFLHWSYDPLVIQRSLPRGLTVDTFEDKAYVGVVPFFMRDVRPNFSPRLPGISDFL